MAHLEDTKHYCKWTLLCRRRDLDNDMIKRTEKYLKAYLTLMNKWVHVGHVLIEPCSINLTLTAYLS